MENKIKNILLNFLKKKQIPGSKVVCELIADELVTRGVVIPVYCHECKHRTEDGFCHQDISTPGYKKTHIFGYCDKGEKL